KNPTLDILCCARAASGHAAAAPPSSVMNARRFMSSMGTSSPMRYQPADRPVRSVFRHLSLLQRGWLVLGSDLNCSESAWAAAGPAPQRITRQRETCSTADFGPLFVRFGS